MKGSAYAVHFDMKLLSFFYLSENTNYTYRMYIIELTFIHFFYINWNTWKVSSTNFVVFFNFPVFNYFLSYCAIDSLNGNMLIIV